MTPASHLVSGLGLCLPITAALLRSLAVGIGSASLADLGLLLVDHDGARLLGAALGKRELVPRDRAGLFDDLEKQAELWHQVNVGIARQRLREGVATFSASVHPFTFDILLGWECDEQDSGGSLCLTVMSACCGWNRAMGRCVSREKARREVTDRKSSVYERENFT